MSPLINFLYFSVFSDAIKFLFLWGVGGEDKQADFQSFFSRNFVVRKTPKKNISR